MFVMSAGHRLPPFREIAYGANGGPSTSNDDAGNGGTEKISDGVTGGDGAGNTVGAAGIVGSARTNTPSPLTLQQQQQYQQQHGLSFTGSQSRSIAHQQQPTSSTGVGSQKPGSVFGPGSSSGNQGLLSASGVNSLRRPQGVDRLPLDALGQESAPSDAYLGERYFQHPLPPQGFAAASQQQNNMSRALSGNAQSWMGATSLSDPSLLNPSFSSLTSSGRGGAAGIGATGTAGVTSGSAGFTANVGNVAWGAAGGNAQHNVGGSGGLGSLPRSTSPLGLGGNMGTSGAAGGVSPAGWSQDWGIGGDDMGHTGNVASMGMTAAAVAAVVAENNSRGGGAVGLETGGNTPGNVRSSLGGPGLGGSRLGRSMYGGTVPAQNDIALLNSLSNPSGSGIGVGSQGMGFSSPLDPMNTLGPTHGGLIGQQQQQSYQQQQHQRLFPPLQQAPPQLGLVDHGLGQSGLHAGAPTGMQLPLPPPGTTDPLRSAVPKYLPSVPGPVVQRRGRGPGRKRTLGDDEIEIELTNGDRVVLKRGVDGKFPCPECNKKLVNSSTLQNHIKSVHQNAGKHICQFCPPNKRKFMWASTLDIHIRHVHKKERPFPCPLEGCTQGFRWQSHLQEHIIVSHEKRRDYTCPVCAKDFGRKNNWQKHIRNVHRVKDVAGFLAKFKATGGNVAQSLMLSNQSAAGPSALQRQTSRYRTAPQVEVPPLGLPPQQRRHRPDGVLQDEEHFRQLGEMRQQQQQPRKRARRG